MTDDTAYDEVRRELQIYTWDMIETARLNELDDDRKRNTTMTDTALLVSECMTGANGSMFRDEIIEHVADGLVPWLCEVWMDHASCSTDEDMGDHASALRFARSVAPLIARAHVQQCEYDLDLSPVRRDHDVSTATLSTVEKLITTLGLQSSAQEVADCYEADDFRWDYGTLTPAERRRVDQAGRSIRNAREADEWRALEAKSKASAQAYLQALAGQQP